MAGANLDLFQLLAVEVLQIKAKQTFSVKLIV